MMIQVSDKDVHNMLNETVGNQSSYVEPAGLTFLRDGPDADMSILQGFKKKMERYDNNKSEMEISLMNIDELRKADDKQSCYTQ